MLCYSWYVHRNHMQVHYATLNSLRCSSLVVTGMTQFQSLTDAWLVLYIYRQIIMMYVPLLQLVSLPLQLPLL